MMQSVHTNPSIYAEGYEAYLMGEGDPYEPGSSEWLDFEAGYQDALDIEHGVM